MLCWWMKDGLWLSLPLLLPLLPFFFWALVLPVCAGLVGLSAILFDALHPLFVQCLESPVGKRKRSLAVSSSQDPSFSGLNQVWNYNRLLIFPQILFAFGIYFTHLGVLLFYFINLVNTILALNQTHMLNKSRDEHLLQIAGICV